jgi:hypothetical protein
LGRFDERRQGFAHFDDEAAAIFGSGAAGVAGEAVLAGLRDDVGEDLSAGPIGIIFDFIFSHAVGIEKKHKGGLRAVGVEILAIVDELVPDASGKFKAVFQADLKMPRMVEADAVNRAPQRRRIPPMRVDDQQSAKACAHQELTNLSDRQAERFWKEGQSSGPMIGMAEGAAVGDGWKHGYARFGRGVQACCRHQNGVSVHRQMRSMLFGCANRKNAKIGAALGHGGYLRPSHRLPEKGFSLGQRMNYLRNGARTIHTVVPLRSG